MSGSAMKVTIDRLRIMKALAKPGGFAFPDGRLPVDIQPPGLRFIGKAMFGALTARGYIEECRPHTKELRKGPQSVAFVWGITDKGMDWIKRAEAQVESNDGRWK